jgi:hypothetical protein
MAEYSIPPWLSPQPLPELLQRSLIAGANQQNEAAQLAQARATQAAAQRLQQQKLMQDKLQFASTMAAQQSARQAAQRFQEQQMARLQQQDAQKQAQWEAEFGLQSSQAARKSAAMQEYQKRVGGGEDPLKVMMELGPIMGESGTALGAAIRRQAPAAEFVPGNDETGQPPYFSLPGGGVHLLPQERQRPQWVSESRQDDDGNLYDVLVNQDTGDEKPAPRAPRQSSRNQMTDSQRESARDRLEKQADQLVHGTAVNALWGEMIESDEPPDGKWPPQKQRAYSALQKRYKAFQARIEDLENGGNGLVSEAIQQGGDDNARQPTVPRGTSAGGAGMKFVRGQDGSLVPAPGPSANLVLPPDQTGLAPLPASFTQ